VLQGMPSHRRLDLWNHVSAVAVHAREVNIRVSKACVTLQVGAEELHHNGPMAGWLCPHRLLCNVQAIMVIPMFPRKWPIVHGNHSKCL
jgi:hypothetical protein